MTDLTQLTFSFDNFTAVATAPNVRRAFDNTVKLGLIAPTITVLLGLVCGFVINRLKLPGSRLLEYIGTMPIAIPGIVFASGMVWIYVRTPLYATLTLLAIAYVASYLPHALRLTTNGLLQIDRPLEEASMVSGGSRLRTLAKITLPLTKPAMLASWVMIFIFTVREINMAVLLTTPRTNVLSVLTWGFVQDGSLARATVVGLLQTALMVLGIVAARFILRVKLTSETAR
jgi:iron(III) transport system permease protein